jgi:hypothetical protein
MKEQSISRKTINIAAALLQWYTFIGCDNYNAHEVVTAE